VLLNIRIFFLWAFQIQILRKVVRKFRRLANKTKLEANTELGIHAIELFFSSCSPGSDESSIPFYSTSIGYSYTRGWLKS